jgi:hypothetical protein
MAFLVAFGASPGLGGSAETNFIYLFFFKMKDSKRALHIEEIQACTVDVYDDLIFARYGFLCI